MGTEAWKDNGNCKDCRRTKYCKTPCTAYKKRIRKIMGFSMMAGVGKMMLIEGERKAQEAKAHLAKLRNGNGEDDSAEAIDAAFDRCKALAQQSKYTAAQIVESVIAYAISAGKSTDEVLAKLENEWKRHLL